MEQKANCNLLFPLIVEHVPTHLSVTLNNEVNEELWSQVSSTFSVEKRLFFMKETQLFLILSCSRTKIRHRTFLWC